jgi:polyisoprenoid-binding protein YceI
MSIDATAARRNDDGVEAPVPGTYDLDPTRCYVGFSVRRHLVLRLRGRFRSFRGTLTIAEDSSASGVVVEIDAAGIDTGDAQRDARARAADFLDVNRYPTVTYRGGNVWPVVAWAPDGRDRLLVEGELELHGVTRPVDFEVRFENGLIDPYGAVRVGFTARSEIIADDFGLTCGQVLETGEVILDGKVAIEVELEAVRRA